MPRLVLEAQLTIGGGSRFQDGFIFDHTGHLLHLHDLYGKKLILDLLKGNLAVHERRAAIFSKGTLTRYPFQANTKGLPRSVIVDCVAGFLETVHRPRPLPRAPDFLSWCRVVFGNGITHHFLKPYNEKLWQMSLAKMTTEWQAASCPSPPPPRFLSPDRLDKPGRNATFVIFCAAASMPA